MTQLHDCNGRKIAIGRRDCESSSAGLKALTDRPDTRWEPYEPPPARKSVTSAFYQSREPSMKKIVLVGFAILAVSTSGALAKKATKPKATAATATAMTTGFAASQPTW
jgi:hypothetical protein